MDYKKAGVDIEEGYRAVGKYRELAAGTIKQSGLMNRSVINDIGSFAGMFSLKELITAGKGMEDPVLVSGTDGVGTKLDIAFRMGVYHTVGIDCVAMCVNDILCHGARPLFFLDYLACGKLDADIAADMVKGVAVGCRETGCALLGGETAEMPGFYDLGKYDIAGFAVGLVDRKDIVDGRAIRPGDALIGVASSGPHSNGFSLIRKALPDLNEDFGGMPIGRALLEPTRLYVAPVLELMAEVPVRGMAHITGGGFYENIPRMFSEPLQATIFEDSWTIPAIFARLAYGIAIYDGAATADGAATGAATADGAAAAAGNAPRPQAKLTGRSAQEAGMRLIAEDSALRRSMFNTFNMGIGFVLAVAPEDAEKTIGFLDAKGFPAWRIGRVDPAAAAAAGTGTGGKGQVGEVRFVRA